MDDLLEQQILDTQFRIGEAAQQARTTAQDTAGAITELLGSGGLAVSGGGASRTVAPTGGTLASMAFRDAAAAVANLSVPTLAVGATYSQAEVQAIATELLNTINKLNQLLNALRSAVHLNP